MVDGFRHLPTSRSRDGRGERETGVGAIPKRPALISAIEVLVPLAVGQHGPSDRSGVDEVVEIDHREWALPIRMMRPI
jgi:hypothetical protein